VIIQLYINKLQFLMIYFLSRRLRRAEHEECLTERERERERALTGVAARKTWAKTDDNHTRRLGDD
jgi:hypothetical protein